MKVCPNCGLHYSATLSHGMVDCVAEFRQQIERLGRDLIAARAEAAVATEALNEIAGAINGWRGE